MQTLKDLFDRLIELGILKRMPARPGKRASTASKTAQPAHSSAPGASAAPAGTMAAAAAGQAVAGVAEATVEAAAPGGGGVKKAA